MALLAAAPVTAQDTAQDTARNTAGDAARTRILALGDSLTQGYGLAPEDGLVPQLQAWLEARGHDVRIINGGVSGDTTAGGLARVEWSLSDDVDAMIVALGGNDVLRGLDPAQTRANLDGILKAGAGRDLPMMLVGLPAAGNFGAVYKAEFEAIFPELAAKHDTLLVPSIFAGLGDPSDPTALRGLMQDDGIHPNAQGVTRIVKALGPEVEALILRAEADPAG